MYVYRFCSARARVVAWCVLFMYLCLNYYSYYIYNIFAVSLMCAFRLI